MEQNNTTMGNPRRAASGWWKLSLVIGFIPLAIVLTLTAGLSLELAVIIVMVAILLSGSMAIWLHANDHATGGEWWQDDDCSGWRGY